MRPGVSIIVPTRNRAGALVRCLRSLARQALDGGRFEIIVVDDGSSDGTAQEVGRFAPLAPAPVLLHSHPTPRGPNAARNLGVKQATGEIVVFVDDDVLAPQGWLLAFVSGLRNAALPAATGPIRLALEGKLPGRHREEISSYLTEVLRPLYGPGGRVVPVGANMGGLRSEFQRVPFDETVRAPNEETDWLLRANLAVAFLPDAWVWHYKQAEEVRRLRLLRLAWRRGGEAGRWTRERLELSSQQRLEDARRALGTALRAYGHGLLRWCWGGLLVGAGETSRGLALLGFIRRKSLPREVA